MGPILQYVVGLPFGIYIFLWGIHAVYKSYATGGDPEAKGFSLWISGICAAAFGGFLVHAILFGELQFSGMGRVGY